MAGEQEVRVERRELLDGAAGLLLGALDRAAGALDRLEALGVRYDHARNMARGDDPRTISADDSAIPVLVVPTDEEMAIAHLTHTVVEREEAWPLQG